MPNGGMAFYLFMQKQSCVFTERFSSAKPAQYVDPKSKFLMLTRQG